MALSYSKKTDIAQDADKQLSGVSRMTDNEIMKALEICSDETIEDGHCKSCPCKDACYGEEGIHALEKAALDLIQRQQKKIESKINGNFSLSVIKSAKDEAVKEFAYKVVEQLERLPNVNSDYWNFSDLIDRDDALEIVKGGAE